LLRRVGKAYDIGISENGNRDSIMKKTIFFVGFALFLFFFKGNSLGGYLDQEYNDMDADENGRISWKEFKFYEKSATPERFSEIDKNSNGKIEFREWITYRDKDYPYESKYEDRERDSYYYKPCPKYCYRYYDSYPRYGFRFHLGHGFKGHRHGFGFYFGNRYHRRYGRHH